MKSLENEKRLISKAKQGDSLAFEKIAFHYLGLINKLSNQYKIEDYDTSDFTQEGLLALLSAVKSYDPSQNTSFKNYALLCVKNRFNSLVRKSNSQRQLSNKDTVSIEDLEITDERNNPESQMLNRERLAYLDEKAKRLLSRMEHTVLSFYIKGYSYKEISIALNISEKAVDNALSRAKKKLL